MWFSRKKKLDPTQVARELRQKALTVEASELKLAPTAARPHVWGVLMETGYPKAVATLATFSDGTTSMYYSSGGGVIGAGAHAEVRNANEVLLSVTEAHLTAFSPAAGEPLPEIGRVRFYIRTFGGTLAAEADEQDLGLGRHPLSPVFHAVHAVIAAVIQKTPKKQVGPNA